VQQMRAATLSDYVEVANSVGLDGLRLLREEGLSLEMLENRENRIPAAAVVRLLERSAEESGCESFGLLIAERRTFASLGPVSLLLERLPDMRAVVRATSAFRRQLNEVVTFEVEEGHETTLIKLDLLPDFRGVQTLDAVVGTAYQVLTGASGGRWQPDFVHTMRTAPSDLKVWRRMFSTGVEFEADFNGYSCSTASLLIPNPLADEEMERNVSNLLRLMPRVTGPEPVGDKVRRTISQLLPNGRATVEQVAAQLGLSPRSVQRRLDEEGLQFGELLASVRQELAVAYLAESSRPVTAIAQLLGYSSPSSFTRWFAGAFGMSPQKWRAEHRATGERPNAPGR